jgi:cytochrome c-type biogenesis protein CcmF
MTGKILVYITLFASLSSTIFYLIAANKGGVFQKIARLSYYALTASIVMVSMYLLSEILSHNFQYTYIWEYSSKELPHNLLTATFYAGQEGSFLLWGLLLTLIGYFLMPYVQKYDYENYVMGFYSLILVFITVILALKSPFEYVWESFPNIPVGHLPENGRGLNPILQNYWITIHPPILFAGYSAMSVPFAFAMAALAKRDYRNWMNVSMPWLLFATGILGFGIMLGGFWAYETLGWGGFWAWDPVENSSLIPWLIAVALVHTMLVSKKTGGLLKTNIFLAIFAFVAVLYATFLTRSGVLGDSSVHSFVSPGQTVYNLLLIMMLTFIVLSTVGLFMRLRDMPNPKSSFKMSSKEFGLSIGSVIILLIAFIVLLGTSWPILLPLLGMEKSVIEPQMYDQFNLPLAIVLLFLNSSILYFNWKRNDTNTLLKKTFPALIFGVFAAIVSSFLGINKAQDMLLVFAAFFSLFINFSFVAKSITKSPSLVGAYVAHVGVGLLLLGALFSGAYEVKEQIRLEQGQEAKFLDYTIKFEDKEQIERHWQDREKYRYNFKITKGDESFYVHPIVYWSDFNKREAPFFEPGIHTYASKDLYFSPYSIETKYKHPPIVVSKNMKTNVTIDTNYSLQLLKFIMPGPESFSGSQIKFGSYVRISGKDFVIEDTLYTLIDQESGFNIPVWKTFAEAGFDVGFMQLDVDKENLGESKAVYAFRQIGGVMERPYEIFTLEASSKPLILLVWFGTILIALGFFFSIYKYVKSNNKIKLAMKKAEEEEILVANTSIDATE